MKKHFSILTFALMAIIALSCSEQNENSPNEVLYDIKPMARQIVNPAVTTFLNSRYGANNYTFGADREITSGPKTYIVNEVKVRNEAVARAYIGLDNSTNAFLYFAEVDRSLKKLEVKDLQANTTKSFTNINLETNYVSTFEFNFVRSTDSDIRTDRWRFWGSSHSHGPCNELTNLAQTYDDYYVLGIRVSHVPSQGSDGGPVIGPCNGEF